MTKDEMQRFLDEEASEGKGELETYRKFMRVLGLVFPGKKDSGSGEDGDRHGNRGR